MRLVTDQKKLSKLVSKPTYVNSKETLALDKPAYICGDVHSGSCKETNVIYRFSQG